MKAIQNATFSCILVVYFNLLLLALKSALRDGIPSLTMLMGQLVAMLLLGIALFCLASMLVILPAFVGGLALAYLIHKQHAQPPYQTKTWQGWVIGGITGFLVLLTVFLIFECVGSMGDNVVTYEPGAAYLLTFYLIEFIFFGGTADVWTHRQVSELFLEDPVDKVGKQSVQ